MTDPWKDGFARQYRSEELYILYLNNVKHETQWCQVYAVKIV